MVIAIGAPYSLLESEIHKRDNAELILMVIAVGFNLSSLKLEIE